MDHALAKAVSNAVTQAAEQIRKQTLTIPGIDPAVLVAHAAKHAAASFARAKRGKP
jgi:hypothetical protein